jgi:phosphotransferase system IIB component
MEMTYLWVALGIAIFIGVYLAYRLLFSKKARLPELTQEETDAYLATLGGIDNIKSVQLDGSRLRFEVRNLKLCDYQGLKNLGAAGIFVSGQQVKFMLKDKAQALKTGIDSIKDSDRR